MSSVVSVLTQEERVSLSDFISLLSIIIYQYHLGPVLLMFQVRYDMTTSDVVFVMKQSQLTDVPVMN